MRIARRLAVGIAVLGLAACGGGGGGGGSASCAPGLTASLSITATGLSPTNVCVQPGGVVTFRNDDTAATHDIEFDTPGCPTVGDIAPGGQKAATFTTQANCSFHDGRNASSSAFQGTVAVTAVTVTGGGY